MTRAPNILFIMMDQLAPQVLAPWGGTVCRTPNIERLADEGVVFDNAYCNHPICAPARFSFMSGRLPSRIGSYDNACELPSEVPAFAHWKYIHCADDPRLLYDEESDPDELVNLSGAEAVEAVERELRDEVFRQWNPADLKERVVESQRRRLFLHRALSIGKRTSWDFSPDRDSSREYVREEGDIQGIYDPKWSDRKR